MDDCQSMILDDLREVKKDVKNLLLDVNTLKVRSAVWGIVGGAIFTLLTIIVPIVVKNLKVTPAQAQTQVVTMDTTKVYSTPIR